MRSVNKLFALFAFAAVVLSACQKEISDDIPDPLEPPVATDSIYLDKMYVLWDEGSGMDTFGMATAYYDNLKRVSAFTTSVTDDNGKDSIRYYYNGTDTLPYKSLIIYFQNGVLLTDTVASFFSYDNQGRKIKDSVLRISYSGTDRFVDTRVTKTSYSGSQMFGETVWTDAAPSTTIFRDTAILNASGDIITNKKYRKDGASFVLATTSDFTYDNHPSPFARMSNIQAHRMFPNGETIEFEYLSYQNVITQNEETVFPAPYDFSQSFTHEYNATGLVKRSLFEVGTVDEERILYTYKSL